MYGSLCQSLVFDRAILFATGAYALAAFALGELIVPHAHGAAFEFERVDGDSASISSAVGFALAADGTPHVVYGYDAESARYARKSGGAWTYDRLDFGFLSEGAHPSIEADGAGNPRIIYQSNNVETPLYLRKSGGAWTVEVPPVGNQSGMFNSLELDTQDFPHFTDVSSGLTYMIRYHRRVAAGWIVETVDFINDIGVSGSSLALDASDGAHVTYTGAQAALRYARRTGGAWTIETIDPAGAGVWAPIQIDASGNTCVAYANGSGIHYARRAAGAWTIETPFVNAPTGFGTLSLALDTDGEPRLAYTRGFFEGDLYYARRSGGLWIQEVVLDNENYLGYTNVLVLDANGDPHIVFSDGTAGDILYARPPSTTGVGSPGERAIARVRITPNPSRDGVVAIEGIALARSSGAIPGVEALVVDASGRIVRRLRDGSGRAASLSWDGRDAEGRAAPTGVYFVRLTCGGEGRADGRLTIVR